MVSNSLELVDFAVGLVNSVLNLHDGQVNFLGGNSNSRRTVVNPAHQIFLRLVEMTFGLVHASYSLSAKKTDFLCTPQLQTSEVKHTPLDSIMNQLYDIMNPLVIAKTSIKFKSALLHA